MRKVPLTDTIFADLLSLGGHFLGKVQFRLGETEISWFSEKMAQGDKSKKERRRTQSETHVLRKDGRGKGEGKAQKQRDSPPGPSVTSCSCRMLHLRWRSANIRVPQAISNRRICRVNARNVQCQSPHDLWSSSSGLAIGMGEAAPQVWQYDRHSKLLSPQLSQNVHSGLTASGSTCWISFLIRRLLLSWESAHTPWTSAYSIMLTVPRPTSKRRNCSVAFSAPAPLLRNGCRGRDT